MIRTILQTLLTTTILASCNDNKLSSEKTTNSEPSKTITTKVPVAFGKYGCTAAKYVNGAYEWEPKGSLTLHKDLSYTYLGFEKPSKGNFTVDDKGVIHFKEGYLNGGKATPMPDSENRYYVEFPASPHQRWTASLL